MAHLSDRRCGSLLTDELSFSKCANTLTAHAWKPAAQSKEERTERATINRLSLWQLQRSALHKRGFNAARTKALQGGIKRTRRRGSDPWSQTQKSLHTERRSKAQIWKLHTNTVISRTAEMRYAAYEEPIPKNQQWNAKIWKVRMQRCKENSCLAG